MRRWRNLLGGRKIPAHLIWLIVIVALMVVINLATAPAKKAAVAPAAAPPTVANVDPRVDWVKMPGSSPGNSVIGPVVVARCDPSGNLVTVVSPTSTNPSIAVLPKDPACIPSQDQSIP